MSNPSEPVPPAGPPGTRPPGKEPPHRHKVLIADDTSVNRFVLEHAARAQGLDVLTATNGGEAIAGLKSNPDTTLALLDWMMPGISGLEVTRWIRRRETAKGHKPYVYVIMVTARDQRQDLHDALGAGADDYLVKPVDPVELKLRIAAGTRMVELQRALRDKISELQRAMDEVQALQDLLPMCMYCKKVRDDNGYWERVEHYIMRSAGASVSHGICPQCYREQMARLEE